MIVESHYRTDERPESKIIIAVLTEDKDRHEYEGFVSEGKGQVVINESPATGTDWQEYDLDDSAVTDFHEKIVDKGWESWKVLRK